MCSCSLYFAVPRRGHDLGICRTKLEDEESPSRAMLEFKYFVETIPRHKNHVCNLRLRVVFVLVVPPSFVGLCAILRGIASGAQVGSHVSNNICQHNVNCKVAIAMPMSISAAGPRYPGGLSPCIQLQLPMASKLPTTPINYSYSFPYCCRAASKLSTITTPMAIRMAVAQPRCYQPFVWPIQMAVPIVVARSRSYHLL